ncbi:unnamed protein product [Durusdinium trenchii]|uniref:J domain-containing protein n=1 Tax=Durusdinium trenchii TaxID=1381693 RepID=A0ABP0QXK9_9DINO
MAQNYYDVLGITRDATVEEIKRAYKKAALTHHPDKGGDEDKFKECGAAVETLTDERKRAAYDSTLVRLRSKDGLGSGFHRFSSRDSSSERPRPGAVPKPPPAPQTAAHVPQPPKAKKNVEIPSDPGILSIKELKELLTALGIDHDGCLEKADLLALLRDRKAMCGGDTPRESSVPKPPPAAPSSSSSATAGRALRVKVMSIGSATVGKSTLIKRYCESRFVQKYIPTIGIDYGVKPVRVLGHDLKVNFFDTSGLRSRGAPGRRVALCANKLDLGRRAVSRAEGEDFAASHGMRYFETSAATGEQVTEAMNYLFEQAVPLGRNKTRDQSGFVWFVGFVALLPSV